MTIKKITRPELLAPAGNIEILRALLHTNCDAFYFGGKNFNMRLHRSAFNFDDGEMNEAVAMIHSAGKKAYITVNNLNNADEMKQLPRYLDFVASTGCDAVLVQDCALLPYALTLGVPVHASVMMNVHNGPTIERLRELGVKRAVLSREMPLAEVKLLSQKTDFELEYFVHGDMCVAHGGQCLYSGMLFGESSNRGRCLKPCRWGFIKDGEVSYPLAVKDMCMYAYIPELIDAGICCFKIEGRMRDAEYLSVIINAYGDAIDRYIGDAAGFDRYKDYGLLHGQRKRDFSTAYAFGYPGVSNINTRMEGTGAFYSTGKMFSQPKEERGIGPEDITRGGNEQDMRLRLAVRVQNKAQALTALSRGVNRVILSGDVFLPDKPFTKRDIFELAGRKGSAELIIGLPHMMKDIDFTAYRQLINDAGGVTDGIFCTNLGAVKFFKGYKLHGDLPLNIYNAQAAGFYQSEGVTDFIASPELKQGELNVLLAETGSCGAVLHGSPTVMYLEYDLSDGKPLTDSGGFKHPLYKDSHGRNHILPGKPLCLLPVLPKLYDAGLRYGLIEAASMTTDELDEVLDAYTNGGEKFLRKHDMNGFTLGALNFL